MRTRLFWKLGLTYMAVLLGVLVVFAFYQEPSARLRLLGLCAILLVAGIALAFFFSRVFASRIQTLKNFSSRIGTGDFRPMELDGPQDELSDLGNSLNQTAAQLDREMRLLSGEQLIEVGLLGGAGRDDHGHVIQLKRRRHAALVEVGARVRVHMTM